jgi:hypothetical protein
MHEVVAGFKSAAVHEPRHGSKIKQATNEKYIQIVLLIKCIQHSVQIFYSINDHGQNALQSYRSFIFLR